jgi:hypothetical protein
MMMPDEFCNYYKEYLDGIYDCVDHIVLNAYFYLAQSNGGFRTWWRRVKGSDDDLNNTSLMRFAGRFSRRIHAYAKKHGIPLIHSQRGERKHGLAEPHLPKDPAFRGVFCIIAGLAPAPFSTCTVPRVGQSIFPPRILTLTSTIIRSISWTPNGDT